MIKQLIAILLLLSLLISCKNSDQAAKKSLSGDIEFSGSWARPAAPASNSAAYLTIYNGTNQADSLLSVSSEVFEKAEVHESYQTQDGLSGMRPAANLAIPSGDSLVLKPGGMHAMLMGAIRAIAKTDSITIILRFKKAKRKSVRIPVQLPN